MNTDEVNRHLKESAENLVRFKNLGLPTHLETVIYLWFSLPSNEEADSFLRRVGDIDLTPVRAEHVDAQDEIHNPKVCASMKAIPDLMGNAEFFRKLIQFAHEHSAIFDHWSTKDVLKIKKRRR